MLSLGIYLTVLVCLQYIPGPGEGVYSVDYTRPICSSLPESLQVPNLYICLSLFPQAIDACRMKEGRGGSTIKRYHLQRGPEGGIISFENMEIPHTESRS